MTTQQQQWLLGSVALATLAVLAYSLTISVTVYSNVIIGRDEANFTLKSTLDMLSATSWQTWFNALFQTHGQHVLVGMQLSNLLSYYTTGFINFQLLNVFGWIYLAIAGLLIILKAKPDKEYFILLSAIVFPLAFSPGHSSCALNVSCTGNHYLGLSLAIVSLYFFTEIKSIVTFITAELLLALAVLSSPAALPLAILALPALWLTSNNQKLFTLLHLACSALILLIYYWAISRADISLATPQSEQDLLEVLALILLTFFRIVGSVAFWSQGFVSSVIALLLGFSVTTAGLVLIWREFKNKQQHHSVNKQAVFYALGFILLLCMIGLISLGRFYELGSTRYVFYSCFCFIFLLLFLFSTSLSIKNNFNKTVLVSIIFLLYYPIQYQLNKSYIQRIRGDIVSCETLWVREAIACGVMIGYDEATKLLHDAQAQGILPNELLTKKQ